MRTKSRALALGSMAMGTALFLSACSGALDTPETPAPGNDGNGAPAESVSIDVAVLTAESDIISQTMARWAERTAELTDGAVTLEMHYAGSLVPPNQTLDAVGNGSVDAALQPTSFGSGAIVDLSILEVPFSHPVSVDALGEFHEQANPILDEIYAEHGQKVVCSNPAMIPTGLACNEDLGPDVDLSGKLLRTAGPWQAQVGEAWGASPIVLPTGELYTALQTGTADCTMLIYNILDSNKIAEVAPFMIRTDFQSNYQTVNMNLDLWNSLEEATQEALLEAGADAQAYGLELIREQGESIMQNLIDTGATFCTPAEEVVNRLISATEPTWEAIEKEVGENGQKLIDLAQSFRDDIITQPEFGPDEPC